MGLIFRDERSLYSYDFDSCLMISYKECSVRDYSNALKSLDDGNIEEFLFLRERAAEYHIESLINETEQNERKNGYMNVALIGDEDRPRSMTPEESLYASLFQRAYAQSINELTIEQGQEKILQLEKVAKEAKASIRGYSQGVNEKIAKLSKSERDKLLSSGPDITVSDSIAGVKRRQDKITRADKFKSNMSDLVDEETLKLMMSNIKLESDKQKAANEGMVINSLKAEAAALVERRSDTRQETEGKPVVDSSFFDDMFK